MFQRHTLESIPPLLKKALALAENQGASHISQIRLALGEIAGLDQQAIRSHWLEISKDTPAEHAALYFHILKAEVQCMSCFRIYHPEGGEIHCPHCGSFGAKVLRGEEFYLESIA